MTKFLSCKVTLAPHLGMSSMIGLSMRSLFFALVIINAATFGQGNGNGNAPKKRGEIIYPVNNTSPILDPNGDGFVSKTTAGFSNRDYNIKEFETPMFGIPKLGGDVTGDNIGNDCGITDLIPDSLKYSVYAVRTIYQGAEYLIFRFRVGDDNPSVESWTILLDTDNKIGAADNPVGLNPGFEIDITFIKRQNAGIRIYNINGIDGCPNPVLEYPYNTHFQISVADEVTCGDPDYFYDYYVPFAPLATAFNITSSTGLRYAAVTNVSATCAMAGKIADISGVNYDDYKDCIECAFLDLIDNQCPTPVTDLATDGPGFEKEKVSRPTIYEPIRAGQTVVSGTTVESNIYVKLFVYENLGTASSPDWGSTPREVQQGYAAGTQWSFTLNQPLQGYDSIVAQTQLTASSVPCGGAGGNNTSSTSVTIVEPNDKPVATPQSLTTPEDVALSITLTGSDPDADPITFSIVPASGPSHGTLNGSGISWTYTPFTNYSGPDSFNFITSDGIFLSDPGTISITVSPVNDAPVVANRSVTTAEDTALPITLSGTDIEGDVLTFTVVTPPTNGVLSGTLPNLIYTPNPDYFGPDSFTFRANDATLSSGVATVSITITPVNDNPIAVDKIAIGQLVTTPEDTPVGIQLFGYDPDGNPVTYTLVTSPAHGTLSGTLPNLTYTPTTNYFGPDSFTFKVNDGSTDSNIATVSITVTPVDDNPVAVGQTVTTPEDTPINIGLQVNNPDLDPLTHSYAQPANGVVTGTGPTITYTPNPNYFGSDSFTFFVNNGSVNSNTATVSIVVTRVDNDAPVATPQTLTTAEENPLAIALSGLDPDGQSITVVNVTAPTNGTLTGIAPNVTYTPNLNFTGADSFTFRVSDGTNTSTPATVSITVTPLNDAPVVANRSVTTPEDTALPITLTATDPDGPSITFSVVSAPTKGILSGTLPNLTYTPNGNFFGSDSFTYRANDGTLNSNIATIFITVTRVDNDAPIADNKNVTTPEDTQVPITLTGSDPDGQAITYAITGAAANGTLLGTAPNVTYRPNLNFTGSDTFKYTVSDGTNTSAEATVTINVTPVNDQPVANSANYTYVLNTTTSLFDLTGSDPEGSALSYEILTDPNPLHGTLNGKPGPNGLSFTPTAGFTGAASFTFRVNDGNLNSAIATITFTQASGVNTAPDAPPVNPVVTPEDTSIEILLPASDVDGNSLTYIIVTPPSQGALSAAGPTVTYTPSPNYSGPDAFQFKVQDNGIPALESSVVDVLITVTPVNDAPVATPQSVSLAENTSTGITLSGTDLEGSGLSYEVVTNPQFGTLSGTAPNLTYTPNLNYNGSDGFTFRVNDGSLNSAAASVLITITPVNSAPILVYPGGQTATTPEDTPINVVLEAVDPDGDALTYVIVTPPQHGSLIGTGPEITYVPDADYIGPDSFEFKVVDDGTPNLESGVTTVSITVTPVNDAPVATPQSEVLAENSSKNLTLAGTDIDLNTLSYELLTLPQHGVLKEAVSGTVIAAAGIVQAALVYTPEENYNGSDNFTFRVNDGSLNSGAASVLITITPVNSIPVVLYPNGQTLTTPEETPLEIILDAVDADGDALTFKEITPPQHGSITYNGLAVTYTPNPDFVGQDSFEFTVNDGVSDALVAVVIIDVTPLNDVPIATNQELITTEDLALSIVLAGTDADVDDLTYELLTQPLRGSITGTAPNLLYTPNSNYTGQDNFSFRVVDENMAFSNPATISITITPLNDAPIASPQMVTTLEEVAIALILEAADPDGDVLSYSIVTQPQHGTLSGTAPNVMYEPAPDYFGEDSFTFIANDGTTDSAPATITITVEAVGDAPRAFDLQLTTPEDTPLDLTVSAADPDLSTLLSFVLVSRLSRGVLSGTLPTVTYTPPSNFTGEEQFTFLVNDGLFESNVATVTITVTPVNDPPVFDALTHKLMDEDSTLQICRNASDPEGDEIVFGDPVNIKGGGTMVPDPDFNFCYLYTPPANYNGEVRWQLSVTDANGASGTVTVNITVNPVNDPPVAVDDIIEVPSRTPTSFNVLENDLLIADSFKEFYDIFENDASYVDGLVLTTTPVSGPHHGTFTMQANGNVVYTPNEDYGGEDEIVYEVCDTYAYHATYCTTAKVLINIGPPDLKVYEAVSPNGDGYNDYWRIDGIEFEPYDKNKVQIFDRYNNLVWETQNYRNEDNHWTGESNRGISKSVLKEGTYYYVITFSNRGPGSGYVILKRE